MTSIVNDKSDLEEEQQQHSQQQQDDEEYSANSVIERVFRRYKFEQVPTRVIGEFVLNLIDTTTGARLSHHSLEFLPTQEEKEALLGQTVVYSPYTPGTNESPYFRAGIIVGFDKILKGQDLLRNPRYDIRFPDDKRTYFDTFRSLLVFVRFDIKLEAVASINDGTYRNPIVDVLGPCAESDIVIPRRKLTQTRMPLPNKAIDATATADDDIEKATDSAEDDESDKSDAAVSNTDDDISSAASSDDEEEGGDGGGKEKFIKNVKKRKRDENEDDEESEDSSDDEEEDSSDDEEEDNEKMDTIAGYNDDLGDNPMLSSSSFLTYPSSAPIDSQSL